MQNILFKIAFSILCLIFSSLSQSEWNVDFSRRTKEIRKTEYTAPGNKQQKQSMFDFVFSTGEPIQEVVVLNTSKGFVPSTLRVKQGGNYKIHVVNVNEKDKNVSFVLDAFSEHHATYYGQIKSFRINPKKEGVFTFQSPETSAQGRLVVYPLRKKSNPALEEVELRSPASEH